MLPGERPIRRARAEVCIGSASVLRTWARVDPIRAESAGWWWRSRQKSEAAPRVG
jgi:hypothetical protein